MSKRPLGGKLCEQECPILRRHKIYEGSIMGGIDYCLNCAESECYLDRRDRNVRSPLQSGQLWLWGMQDLREEKAVQERC